MKLDEFKNPGGTAAADAAATDDDADADDDRNVGKRNVQLRNGAGLAARVCFFCICNEGGVVWAERKKKNIQYYAKLVR